MKKFLCEVSDELWAAIEAARGGGPRNPWLEVVLWKAKAIRDGAAEAAVEKPARAADGRGGARPRRKNP